MKKLLLLLVLTTPCFGQRYEGWTQNPDGTTSYFNGRIVQYRDIDAELREESQQIVDAYLRSSRMYREEQKAKAMAQIQSQQLEELEKQTALLQQIANK